MAYIKGEDRYQYNMFAFNNIDDLIDKDNPVRVIDAFVDTLNLKELGFVMFSPNASGQSPYDRADLLKLHIYGYINKIRSSRALEREVKRNLELIWLLNKVTPAKSCIADFIKDNKKAIRNVLKQFNFLLKDLELIDGELVAIDGSKLRAQNSRKKHFSEKKIDSIIAYLESQIDNYLNDMEKISETDTHDTIIKEKINNIEGKIKTYQQKIKHHKSLKLKLKKEKLSQITLTDPDSRMMKCNGNTDVSFNVQTAVDSKHNLIVACDVVNDVNDTNQLSNMVEKSEEILGSVPKKTVADTGYYNSTEIVKCEKMKTEVYIKKQATSNSTGDKNFSNAHFTYVPEKDIYICPNKKELHFDRIIRRKDPATNTYVPTEKAYMCNDCISCKSLSNCTSSFSRTVSRKLDQDILDVVDKRTADNPEIYKKRKTIVEHPFGTIKRSFGFTYFLRKGLESVNTEAALISLAYNLKRITNIMDVQEILHKLQAT